MIIKYFFLVYVDGINLWVNFLILIIDFVKYLQMLLIKLKVNDLYIFLFNFIFLLLVFLYLNFDKEFGCKGGVKIGNLRDK